MIERVRKLPGVQAVEANTQIPLDGPSVDVQVHVEGRMDPPGSEPFGHFRMVSSGYFQAMRIPLRRGRWFTDEDRAGAPPVVIVNETLAHVLWPTKTLSASACIAAVMIPCMYGVRWRACRPM
jgi:hypothetical protein